MNQSKGGEDRLEELLRLYTGGGISKSEEREFFEMIQLDEDEDFIRKYIDRIISIEKNNTGATNSEVDWNKLYRKIEEQRFNVAPDAKVRKLFSINRWVAAAVVAVLLGAGFYFLWFNNSSGSDQVVQSDVQPAIDIAPPESANAHLTLANGQVVILDEAGNGSIFQEGGINIVKLADGQIAYQGNGAGMGDNILSNPRGSKVINLTLSDGTKVWLNAASTLKYPIAFSGDERRVEVNGEAYFEVAHDAHKPFIVKKGTTEIKVLGTHFNVEAYDDERTLDVTLLEGSVSVESKENGNNPKVIRPGEQAQVKQDGGITMAKSVNLDEVVAWKDNMFSFKGVTLGAIMRQVARWYDVNVVFEQPIDEKFYVEVSKNTNISTLLEMLEATKAVHFKIDGNEIIVKP